MSESSAWLAHSENTMTRRAVNGRTQGGESGQNHGGVDSPRAYRTYVL
jgi:hypothetical protein